MKAAYAGVPGAFSHEACLSFLPQHEPVPVPGFAEVVAAVLSGDAECGVLPVENNSAGKVEEAQALLRNPQIKVVAEHELPVRMHLLVLPGVELGQIGTAVSHPVALKQCARTLERLGLATEPASNTAVAAQSLTDRTKAVLASAAAAAAYGLTILLQDVHDRTDNFTRFAVFSRR
jgi:prephenate dehydratase